MNNLYYILYTFLLFALSLLYFKIARKYKIVDLPNHRTMHEGATIRGGGIVILLGISIFSFFMEDVGIYFSAGLILLGISGFADDILDLPSIVRFPVQVVSVLFMLADLDMVSGNIFVLIIIVVVVTGILNAYNFMDGINGITGGYSLVVVFSLVYVNSEIQPFVSNEFLLFIVLALLIFNYFNFRTKAVCFAGDVGSLSIAFIIVYLILKLIIESQQFIYLLFLTFYGIDTVFTIIQRLIMKENIFDAHRLHFFQVVVSKTGMPHLFMSIIYMVGQAIVNFIVIMLIPMTAIQQLTYAGVMLAFLSLLYIGIKRKYNHELE